jgi:hypothetical protein
MDCKEFKELAPAFALGILDESERAACQAHLGGTPDVHEGCREAVVEAEGVAARLSAVLPDLQPRARVWRRIEAGIARQGRARRAGPHTWRELSGWFVAAAVLGLYLYSTPANNTRKADAATDASPALKQAVMLMMASETRRYVFEPQPAAVTTATATARGSLILNPTERSAVVLVDRLVLEPGRGLRLWTVRNHGAPTPLTRLTATLDGMATADLGTALFEPTLPGELLLSIDPPDAPAPKAVLLAAHLQN